ncbi:MAG: divalent metal cation transporter [Patescibacteria group bacterium]|jgi:NRAMP (natural resistance-associated macrophage protein)-like metal ion transporter
MSKNILEQIAEAPSIALERGLEKTEELEKELISKKPVRAAEAYWRKLGPGLTTGAADDDPSGIATYSQTGAKYGFQLLWLAPLTFPLMAVIQEMCARIGMVTGRGLARNIKLYYPRWAIMSVASILFFANTFNLGADLGIMAKAAQLFIPKVSFFLLVAFFTLASLLLQIFTAYARYARYLKYLALVLFSYVISALCISLDWREVLGHTVMPSLTFSKDQIFLICGILGTTISPYLFFWQSSQEVEEEILRGNKTVKERRRNTTREEIKRMRVDVWSGMFVSNLAMFFIIVACAGALYKNGITDIVSADQAALALRPFAGDLAYYLFALGILGVGLLSVPVLAGSASYALAESFGWKTGLYRKLKDARAFYGVIIISMILGFLSNFIGIDPIKFLIYAAVFNGITAGPLLFFIVRLSSKKEVMGKFKSSRLATAIGWLTVIIMLIAGGATVISMLI